MAKYEQTGNIIKNEINYEQSRLYQFENLLYEKGKYLNANNISGNTDYIYTRFGYIELVAPSLEGKTQSAFAFRNITPLYFPICIKPNPADSTIGDYTMTQNIYENYRNLTLELRRYAIDDLNDIFHLYGGVQNITASLIIKDLEKFESRVLGFISALIKDAQRHEVIDNPSWMRYHATRPNFSFRTKQVCDLKDRNDDIFKGFVLFLDEFNDEPWAVYVRNLAIVIELTCLVVHSNAKGEFIIINNNNSCGGGSSLDVWKIFITSLGPASLYSMNELYKLCENINTIKRNSEDKSLKIFLDNFIKYQIYYLRPGMTELFAEAIADFTADESNSSPNLKDFLDTVLRSVAAKLKTNYLNTRDKLIAQCGKFGLLLKKSYQYDFYLCKDSWMLKGFGLIRNHFYYLLHPLEKDNWIFLTDIPYESSNQLLLISNNRYEDWNRERTYFKEEETLTLLACLFLKFDNTVINILKRAEERLEQNAPAMNNEQIEDDTLNLSVAMSIIDASQHSYGTAVEDETFSLAGQNGTDFIKNLIINLISKYEFVKISRTFEITAKRCSFNVLNAFNEMRIPFLYSFKRDDKFLDKINRISKSVYLKKCEKDKFEFECAGMKKFAIIESENRAEPLKISTLNDAIDKCIKIKKSRLLLVFCDKITNNLKKNSKFTESCDTKKINVYRIKKSKNADVFEFIPFYEKCEDPKILCIILESKNINSM